MLLHRADVYTAKLSARATRQAMAADRGRPRDLHARTRQSDHRGAGQGIRRLPAGLLRGAGLGRDRVVVKRGPTVMTPVVAALTTLYGDALIEPQRRDTSQPLYAIVGVLPARSVRVRIAPAKNCWRWRLSLSAAPAPGVRCLDATPARCAAYSARMSTATRRAATRNPVGAVRGLRYHVNVWGDACDPPRRSARRWCCCTAGWTWRPPSSSRSMRWHRRYVLAPDWRGFGLTDAPRTDSYWFPDYLGDLDALLDALVPEGRRSTSPATAWAATSS
jgi:hypothetical protein